MSSDGAGPYPTILQAIGLVVVLLLFQIVLGIPLGAVDVMLGTSLVTQPVVLAIVNILVFGSILAWGYGKAKARRSEVVPLVPVSLGLLGPMVVTVLGVHILISESDNVLRRFLPVPGVLEKLFAELLDPAAHVWGSLFLLVLVAPVTEELLFRGFILRGFLQRYGVKTSIVASAALFALVHLNPWQLVTGMSLGLLLGWWYVRTGSLVPCLLGHALMNLMTLLLGVIPDIHIPGYSGGLSDSAAFQPIWFDALGVFLVGCGLLMLIRRFGKTVTPLLWAAPVETPIELQK